MLTPVELLSGWPINEVTCGVLVLYKNRVLVFHVELRVEAVEPAVVRRTISVHEVDGMDWHALARQVVIWLPLALVKSNLEEQDEGLHHDEHLDEEGDEAAASFDALSDQLTSHQEGEGGNWHQEAYFLVRDQREHHKVEHIVVGQVGTLTTAALGHKMRSIRPKHKRVHSSEDGWCESHCIVVRWVCAEVLGQTLNNILLHEVVARHNPVRTVNSTQEIECVHRNERADHG